MGACGKWVCAWGSFVGGGGGKESGYMGWVGREGGWGWETEDGGRGRGRGREVRWERGEARW